MFSDVSITARRRVPPRFPRFLGGVLLTLAGSATAGAQGHALPFHPGDGIRVSPEVIVVDPKTHTATFTITNRFDFEIEGGILATVTAPQPRPDSPRSDVVSDAVRGDSIATAWIREPLPIHYVIAPDPQHVGVPGADIRVKTVTLHLAVPDSLKPGEYVTYLIFEKSAEVVSTVGANGTRTVQNLSDEQVVTRRMVYQVAARR